MYVGWTSRDPNARFNEHQTRKTAPINFAIKKHGTENFVFEVIYQSLDYEHSRQIETHFIQEFNSLVEQWGYNRDLGGTGHKRTQVTIEKHREKIKGKKQSADHVEKRKVYGEKNGMYGKTGEQSPRYGKSQSEYQKQRTAEANCKAYVITHPNGTEETIINLRQFALAHNLDPGNLSQVACGRKSHHKGYKARHA